MRPPLSAWWCPTPHTHVLGPDHVAADHADDAENTQCLLNIIDQLDSIMTVVVSWIVQIEVSTFTQPILSALDQCVLELTLNRSAV